MLENNSKTAQLKTIFQIIHLIALNIQFYLKNKVKKCLYH